MGARVDPQALGRSPDCAGHRFPQPTRRQTLQIPDLNLGPAGRQPHPAGHLDTVGGDQAGEPLPLG
jgi:hypothetical protein